MSKISIKKSSDRIGTEINIEYENNGDVIVSKSSKWWVLLSGVIIGFVNGFWGGGGGMICVPILMNLLHLQEKNAHATTLLIMLPLSLASLIVYFINGNLPLNISLPIGGGFVLGGILGALCLKKINNFWLGIVFSIIIIIGGIKMLL